MAPSSKTSTSASTSPKIARTDAVGDVAVVVVDVAAAWAGAAAVLRVVEAGETETIVLRRSICDRDRKDAIWVTEEDRLLVAISTADTEGVATEGAVAVLETITAVEEAEEAVTARVMAGARQVAIGIVGSLEEEVGEVVTSREGEGRGGRAEAEEAARMS